MVFVVVSDIIGEDVQNPIVRICFRNGDISRHLSIWQGGFGKDIMLRNKVGSTWMQRSGQERTQEEIHQCFWPKVGDYEIVEHNLGGNIAIMDRPKGDFINHHGPDGIENQLEGAKKGLAKDRVEKDSLQSCREICI